MAKTKKRPTPATAPRTTTAQPEAAPATSQLRGELAQLHAIRQGLPALPALLARGFAARFSDEDCRARGGNTRAQDIFRDGLRWARTVAAHPGDAALSPVRARWVRDCVTALGESLGGANVTVNPATHAAWDDARRDAEARYQSLVDNVERAGGTRSTWRAKVAAVRAAEGVGDPLRAKIDALVQLLETWTGDEDLAVLAAFGVDASQTTALREAASLLDERAQARGAETPLGARQDSPRVNTLEGRTLYAMRDLWDDAATARAAGTSQLTWGVSPALLRGLGLRSTRPRVAPKG